MERLLRSDVHLICNVEVGGVSSWMCSVYVHRGEAVLVEGRALCSCVCNLVSYQWKVRIRDPFDAVVPANDLSLIHI